MSTFNLYELKKWKDSDSWYDSIISLGKFAMDDNFHRSYRWLNRILSQKWLFINDEISNIRLSSKEIETKFFSLSHHQQYFLHQLINTGIEINLYYAVYIFVYLYFNTKKLINVEVIEGKLFINNEYYFVKFDNHDYIVPKKCD